jgi:hypothetical protein
MFGSLNVTGITFTYEFHTDWFACGEVRGDTTYSGLCCRLDPLIEVTTTAGGGGDPILKLRVDNSWLDIVVVQDPHAEDLWCLLGIEEVEKQSLVGSPLSAAAATEPSSWGGIKSMFQ